MAPRRQGGFVVLMLSLVVLVVAAVLWVVGTSSGAAAGLRLGIGLTGSGHATGIQGSLWSGLSIAELEYSHPQVDVSATDVRLSVDWPRLKERVLSVTQVAAQTLHVSLPEQPESPQEAESPTALQWPQLPLSFDIREVRLGRFSLTRDGVEVPVRVEQLLARLSADAQQASLVLDSLHIHGPDALATIHGAVNLVEQHPIGMVGALQIDVSQGEHHALVDVTAVGHLEDLDVSVSGQGDGMEIDARAQLAPMSKTLPLSAFTARVRGIDPGAWVSGLPPALLNLSADLRLDGVLFPSAEAGLEATAGVQPATPPDAVAEAAQPPVQVPVGPGLRLDPSLTQRLQALTAVLSVKVDEGSTWQKQPLRGSIDARMDHARLPQVKVDLVLGRNTVSLDGSLGGVSDALALQLDLPAPGQVWPGLTGSGKLDATLRGTLEKHELTLAGRVDLPRSTAPRAGKPTPQVKTVAPGENIVVDADAALDLPSVLQQGPINVKLALNGGWRAAGDGGAASRPGWRGQVAQLDIRNREVSAVLASPMALDLVPGTEGTPLQWSAGSTSLRVNLPQRRSFTLSHGASSNRDAQWRSAGSIDGLVPAWLVAQLPRSADPLRVALDWDLAMTRTLEGTVNLQRRGGDLVLPGSPPVSLGLQTLKLQARAVPANGNSSNIAFEAQIAGKRLGTVSARGTTVAVMRDGVPEVSEQQPIQIDARLAVDDLSWISAFTGDATDVGGKVSGDVRIARKAGVWDTSGQIKGSGLRVMRLDDGVRLLDGSADLRLANGQVIVDRLYFPSVIRSAPKDSRVQAWLRKHSSDGSIVASGSWSLADASGSAKLTMSRFALVQRADRFIAGSGSIDIEASPKRLRIDGKVVADVGWISLEGASDLPSLSGDVVIVRAGDNGERAEALPMTMNLEVGLGENFYLRGMGLDTGLAGTINIRNRSSGMRANGVVTARDGRFSIYGQTLVVRRGNVTFEGPLDDPLLDIIAVRPNLRIEAGVQVSGTARNPIITLVSYPDVPEVEKLSWLLLGRSPDASGADAGMLLAAAASLLSDGESEPIYRQLGLDELGLRSGAGGSVRGLLPEQTAVNSINNASTSDAGTQFLVIGKRLTDALYLTFEQALSGRESVVRASYRISDTLSAAVQGGTINGLRLVWSFVFDD